MPFATLVVSLVSTVAMSAGIPRCLKNYLELRAQIDGGRVEDIETMRQRSGSTIRIAGEKTGRHGGKLIIIERTGDTWGTFHSTPENLHFDPQGDPRLFIDSIGSEAAAFFGYRILDDRHVQVPDQQEFRNALKKLEKQLLRQGKEPLAVRFYPAPNLPAAVVAGENRKPGRTRVANYVMAFERTGGVPIALHGQHFLHDINFHTAAIFLPAEYVRFAQAQIRFQLGFFDYLETRASTPEQVKAIRYYRHLMNLRLTRRIDDLTGDVANSVVRQEHRRPGSPPEAEFETLWNDFTREGQSPLEQLKNQLPFLGLVPGSNPDKNQAHGKVLPLVDLVEKLDDYAKDYPITPDFDPNTPFENRYGGWKEMNTHLCKKITQRRKDVLDAVRLLP